MTRKTKICFLSSIAHAGSTIALYAMVFVLAYPYVDAAADVSVPVEVKVLGLIARVFTMPLLYFTFFTFPDYHPASGPVYLIAFILNSALMAWLISWIVLKHTKA